MKNIIVPVRDSVSIEYATSKDGCYNFLFGITPSGDSISIDGLISIVRKFLLRSPDWVLSHVPLEFHEWNWSARFWFRFRPLAGNGGFIYFPVCLSSSNFSSREAAL